MFTTKVTGQFMCVANHRSRSKASDPLEDDLICRVDGAWQGQHTPFDFQNAVAIKYGIQTRDFTGWLDTTLRFEIQNFSLVIHGLENCFSLHFERVSKGACFQTNPDCVLQKLEKELSTSNWSSKLVFRVKYINGETRKIAALLLSRFQPLKSVWETQNSEKMVADIRDNFATGVISISFVGQILSIKVAELLCTSVGLSMAGINGNLCRESKNS